MTLTDAGPLIALIDAGEPDHDRCLTMLDQVALPLLTTWPAFTEAVYLLGRAGGWPAQEALWRMVEREALTVDDLPAESTARTAALMGTYRDNPMDLADASLVALAEMRGLREIFTLDNDFRIYRLKGGQHFTVIPN